MPASAVVAVLDDEPEMRKALRRVLTTRGFCVEEYARGEDLLAAIDAHLPDCLLLDLRMPGLGGLDVLEVFRSRQIRVPVVIVTALDEPNTERQVLALGASACLKKPVDRDVLLSAIKDAMAGCPPIS
jgi:FixJ family two-component response regulator